MEKEENGCRSPSTASSSSESYWGWEWRRTMNIWTCVYCNLLYTSCIAWVITLATEIRQNEPPWASETSSDMWSPPRCSASLRSFGTLGGITYHCSFSSAHGGSFTYHPPIVGWYSVRITFSKEYHLCYTYHCHNWVRGSKWVDGRMLNFYSSFFLSDWLVFIFRVVWRSTEQRLVERALPAESSLVSVDTRQSRGAQQWPVHSESQARQTTVKSVSLFKMRDFIETHRHMKLCVRKFFNMRFWERVTAPGRWLECIFHLFISKAHVVRCVS